MTDLLAISTRLDNFEKKIETKLDDILSLITTKSESTLREVHEIDTAEKLLGQKVQSNVEDLEGLGKKVRNIAADTISKKGIITLFMIVPAAMIAAFEFIKLIKG